MSDKMLLWFRRLTIAGTGLVLLLWLLAWVYEARLGRVVLGMVREELQTPLEVGDFQLSFIRAFPHIRGSFRDVLLADTQGDTLLQCRSLGINLHWSSLWSDTPSLDALILDTGRIRLRLDRKGKPNYQIFKPRDPQSPEKPLALDFRKASLRDILVEWENLAAAQHLAIHSDRSVFKGRIRDEQFTIEHDIRGRLVRWQSASGDPVTDMPVSAAGQLFVDLSRNRYVLKDTRLMLSGLPFATEGMWEDADKGLFFDLKGDTETLPVQQLWRTLHRFYPTTAERLAPRGEARITFSVKGLYQAKRLPGIEATLLWEKGGLSLPSGPDLQDIRLDLVWSQPHGKPLEQSRLTIRQGQARVGGQELSISGVLDNPADPLLDLHINGALPAALIQTNDLAGVSGILLLEDLHLQGKPSRSGLKTSGTASADQLRFLLHGDPLTLPSGAVTLRDNRLECKELRIGLGASEFVVQGAVTGLTDQFRDQPQTTPVHLEGQIHAVNLDVSVLMDQMRRWRDAMADSTQTPATNPQSQAFSLFTGSLRATVGEFRFQEIRGKQFNGSVHLLEKQMVLSGDAEAMGGSFNLEGELSWRNNTFWEGALTCQKVDVREAFRQCQNFGQDFLTMNHLKGRLSAQVLFSAEWDKDGVFLPNNLHVFSAVQIDEGELVNLKVLEAFSDYVHVRDLRHVRFNTLQNYLEVDRGKVYLPRMLIQTNAMALDITGLHGFDQSIDYGIRVDAGQVLVNKITRHDPSLAPKATKRNGWFNLYYHIGGTVDKYAIKSAKGRVRDDFNRSMIHRERIRRVLIEEFGNILFEDARDEEESLAEIPVATAGAALPATTSPALPGPPRSEPKPREQRREESEYLEDFEIIGGSGKRKQ
jgi:hypothetical protein